MKRRDYYFDDFRNRGGDNWERPEPVTPTPDKDDLHFDGYAEARRVLETVTDKSELLAILDTLYGRGDLSEDSPFDQLLQAALDQQERDWRIDPRRGAK